MDEIEREAGSEAVYKKLESEWKKDLKIQLFSYRKDV
jgi:hypothetical protein